MTKSVTEMYEQELLGSEKEKVRFYSKIELDVETPYLVKVKFKGIEIGELIIKTRDLEFNPVGGFKIDLQVRNITPIKE